MPFYIKQIGFNPFDDEVMFSKDKAYELNPNNENWNYIICLTKSVYLIYKMIVMMDLPLSKEINDCFNADMRYAGAILKMGGVDISHLSPYGPKGIAIRGELDYKGNK